MTQEQIQIHVAKAFQARNSTIQTSVNAFLIDTGHKVALVDSGSTDCFGPTMGRMLESIRAAGYSAGDVDDVLLTHLHPDHACGVTSAEGKMAFPNARVWADRDDAEFWLDSATIDQLPNEQQSFVSMAQHALAPYQAAGRLRLFNEGDSLPAGIKAVSSAGHTPGHTSYLVQSKAAVLMVWRTVVHVHSVQMPHPEVTIEVDVDAVKAINARKKILSAAAESGWLVGAAHLPFPGLGHVSASGQGFSWTPVEYAPLPGQLR